MTTIGASPVLVTLARTRRPGRLDARVPGRQRRRAACCSAGRRTPSTTLGGLAFALLAAAGFATLTLLTAKPVDGLGPLATTAFGCLTGGLLLTPVASWTGMALPLHADVLAVAGYLGAVPTALAYAAYLRGLATAHPLLGALSAVLEPLTAAVLSARSSASG